MQDSNYVIESCLQDENWHETGHAFTYFDEAMTKAKELAKDPFNGMIRVVNLHTRGISVTYGAGSHA